MTRSTEVAYVQRKFRTTAKTEFITELEEMPLTSRERAFLVDVFLQGQQLKELSEKYNLTISRISRWKRELCAIIHHYDMRQVMR